MPPICEADTSGVVGGRLMLTHPSYFPPPSLLKHRLLIKQQRKQNKQKTNTKISMSKGPVPQQAYFKTRIDSGLSSRSNSFLHFSENLVAFPRRLLAKIYENDENLREQLQMLGFCEGYHQKRQNQSATCDRKRSFM